jgi:hypothetical protein
MEKATRVAERVLMASAGLALVLGLIVWINGAYEVLGIHELLGYTLIASLWMLAVIAARSGGAKGPRRDRRFLGGARARPRLGTAVPARRELALGDPSAAPRDQHGLGGVGEVPRRRDPSEGALAARACRDHECWVTSGDQEGRREPCRA